MKGLLLKDLYMIKKYFWSYLLIVIGFTFVLASSGNSFYGVFPCLLVGSLPMSIQAYDEKEKWFQYSGSLPITKVQLVSVKYICSIGFILIEALSSALLLTFNMLFIDKGASLTFYSIAALCSMYPLIGAVLSFCLAFIFRLGAEKGRFVYMIFGGLCGAVGAILGISAGGEDTELLFNEPSSLIVCAIMISLAALLYAISWLLSIAFYKKREI